MAFNRKVEKSGVVRRFCRCSRYANSGSKSCSMHTIGADTLKNIILADIQYYAQTAITDEKRLYDRFLSFSGQEWENEKAAQEKILRNATNRISFIQDASKRLFEEKIMRNVLDSLFKNMLFYYEQEINAFEEKSENIRRQLQGQESGESNAQKWLRQIKSCISIGKLDWATAFQLIDHVVGYTNKGTNAGIRPKPFRSSTTLWGV